MKKTIANLKILNDIFLKFFEFYQMQIHIKNIDKLNYRIAHDFIATNINDIDIILNLFWLHKINFVINWQKRRWFFRKLRANREKHRKIKKIHKFKFFNQKINVKHNSNKFIKIVMLINFVDVAVFVQMYERTRKFLNVCNKIFWKQKCNEQFVN